jgi:hypothetical protein
VEFASLGENMTACVPRNRRDRMIPLRSDRRGEDKVVDEGIGKLLLAINVEADRGDSRITSRSGRNLILRT